MTATSFILVFINGVALTSALPEVPVYSTVSSQGRIGGSSPRPVFLIHISISLKVFLLVDFHRFKYFAYPACPLKGSGSCLRAGRSPSAL